MTLSPRAPEMLPPRSGDIDTILDLIDERRRRRSTRLIGGTGLTVIVAAIVVFVTILIPHSSQTGTSASVADVVRMNGIDYGNSDTYRLPRSLLGHRIGTIQRQLHINDTGPNPPGQLATKETISTTWPKGTAIYSVKGYRPTFRIAAVTAKQAQMYQVDLNPRARRGNEILDIDGKVQQIEVVSDRDRVLGHIRDADVIARLTHQIAIARLNPSLRGDDIPLFLRFHLRDGTIARVAIHDRPYLSPGGIIVPKSFYDAILKATHHK